jgi:hypothetical protein
VSVDLHMFTRHIELGLVGVRWQALWSGVGPSGLSRAELIAPRGFCDLAVDILDWWKQSNTFGGCGAGRRDI